MARQLLGNVPVGSVIQLKEDNVLTDFYVAKHDYEFELNGFGRTLLVRKEVLYGSSAWNALDTMEIERNIYEGSTLDKKLSSYRGGLDSSVVTAMGTTKFYYTPGETNLKKSVLQRSVFSLSGTELGFSANYLNVEGSALPIAETLKTATYNGKAAGQHTRSPYTDSSYGSAWVVNGAGGLYRIYTSEQNNIRPTFTLPESVYINDDGTVTMADKTPQTLGSKQIGRIVRFEMGGVMRSFIVVHQGKPGDMYDDSCDGTWLLIEDIYEKRIWNGPPSTEDYLNNTVLGMFEKGIREKIKLVKIPYTTNPGSDAVKDGADGKECKLFVPSTPEVGNIDTYNSGFTEDGAKLDYFIGGGSNTEGNKQRIAYYNGVQTAYFLRSWDPRNFSAVHGISDQGAPTSLDAGRYENGIRFMMILPPSLLISDDGSVVPNAPPSAPGSIDLPDSVYGGSAAAVSWSAASDPENNLEGYVVERSTDGGSTWTQIYQGPATSTTNTVPQGTETVIYRVRAYDSEGAFSSWRTSGQVTVINNNAPTAPGGITVPETVLGGAELAITWGAASDKDGNLAGYSLERQVDGGEWSEVYRDSATGYTDTVTRGWTSVAYRVRAYDSYDVYSGYATSPVRTVNNNIAPVITCEQESGTDLGAKAGGFSVAYSVGDEDGDPVTVAEAVDGVVWRTFAAEAGRSYTLEVDGEPFMRLLNGTHELTVSASDGQVAAVHKLTFTKEVTAATVTLEEPMEADDQITICVLSVLGSIPADAKYSVMVTNNALDDEPVWEDCTDTVKNGANYIFTNETAVNGFAFNFKVEVERGESGQGGYINSVQGGFQ